MCGIAGWWSVGIAAQQKVSDRQNIANRMAAAVSHRGPDDSGVWLDDRTDIALAHCRLAILDISSAGHQPMVSASGRFVIVFNGEVYNHLELRQSLAGETWQGHSDTETLLAGIEAWGVDTTLGKCVGMFAFALWDRATSTLTLARDRMGEKPLYYGWQNGIFLFGSELKALRAHPAFSGEIDRGALALFLRYNYIPKPWSIYHGIKKFPPGAFWVLGADGKETGPVYYWSAQEKAETGQQEFFTGDADEAQDELERFLREAVAGQMLADVPLGAFLSGGIDSSMVVALMQAQISRPVKTFTIGSHRAGYNEAEHAAAVAKHLGTDHTELYVTSEEVMAVIPRLPELYDEPFADSSQIPTFLISQLARHQVTVALSGDGGDELFGGYNRYLWATNIRRITGWLPTSCRAVASRALTMLPPHVWNKIFRYMATILPSGYRYANPGDKLHKLAGVMAYRSSAEMYERLISFWQPGDMVVRGAAAKSYRQADSIDESSNMADFVHRMMYQDMVTYLPDDILVKVDRAAMAVSLETRIPMLDHRLVEFAWRLPLAMKIRNGQGKWLLRQVLYKYVPKELVERPKMGFGIPLDAWLRGPLREWAESLLAEDRLRREGFFYPAPIRRKWAEHLAGSRNWAYHLWGVLMFQAWLEKNG